MRTPFRFRALSLLPLTLLAGLAVACGDSEDGTTSSGGGGTGGETPATTTSSGGGGQGGQAQGGGDAGGGDAGGGDAGGGGAGPLSPDAIFTTTNPAGRDGDTIQEHDLGLGAALYTHGALDDVIGVQSAVLDADDGAFLTYDRAGGLGGVMYVADAQTLASSAIGEGTRRIEGAATGLMTPKGIEIADDLVLVADTGAMNIKAFEQLDEGNQAPVFTITDLDGAVPWDMDYDAGEDRLYVAATNGNVLVYDDLLTDMGATGPDRTITPSVNGNKVSVNLHGIELVAANATALTPEVLVLSDVGDAASATDGQLFTIASPATANGNVNVRGRISGATSALGNPVDLTVDSTILGVDVYVAEKSNDRIARFDDIASLTTAVEVAPDAFITVTKPESIFPGGADFFVTTNPTGRDADALHRITNSFGDATAEIEATLGDVGRISSVQSVTFTGADAVLTYDRTASRGGVMFVDGVADATATQSLGLGTRRVEGAATGLVGPKGLVVSTDLDAVIVADTGGFDVKLFALDAEGDVAPIHTVDDLGLDGRRPWDVAYDAAGDRLFVATTDGNVLVYDDFSTDFGASGPARTITPAEGGSKISVNLHGIDYDAALDLLVLSDVGDAANATDGQLFTIDGAAAADGLVNVTWRALGANTKLGNPVDLVLANGHAYVAEKSNDVLLRFDDVAGRSGTENLAADVERAATKPESVALTFE